MLGWGQKLANVSSLTGDDGVWEAGFDGVAASGVQFLVGVAL